MKKINLSTWLCFIILLLFAVVLTSVSPLLMEISKTFNLSMSEVGFLFTANFIGFAVFILFGGIASDYWGKKRVLSASLVLLVALLFLFPLSPNFFVACVVTVFLGGCCGVVESIANALVADLNSEDSSFFINLAQVFFGVGALLGPVLIGMAISKGLSWQEIYYIMGSLFGILTIIFVFVKFPILPILEKFSVLYLKLLLTDPKFLLFCLCMFLYTGAEVGGWGWMSTFMQKEFKFSLTKSSIAVSVFWGAIIVGRAVCTSLISKVSPRLITAVLAFSAAVITIVSGLVKSELAVWLVIAALGLALSSQWSLIVACGSETYKKSSGTVFAIFVGSGGVGMAFIPLIQGVIGQYIGIRMAMMSTAGCFLIIGLIFTRIKGACEY